MEAAGWHQRLGSLLGRGGLVGVFLDILDLDMLALLVGVSLDILDLNIVVQLVGVSLGILGLDVVVQLEGVSLGILEIILHLNIEVLVYAEVWPQHQSAVEH